MPRERTSGRPYRDPLTPAEAIDELTRNAGTQFDASVVSAFLDVIAERDAATEPRACRRSGPASAERSLHARRQIGKIRFEMSPIAAPDACCAPLAAEALSDDEAAATAAVFAALGSPARVRLVNLLASSDEPVCLCHLVEPVGLAQATVSEHLKKLVEAGLVLREERGKWSYFAINAGSFERVAALADLAEGACC
jgi:ArsR family transcriptional regulator